jgi:hypothetical protein
MSRRWKSAPPSILATGIAAMALGACGGSSPSSSAESAARESDVKFTRCLREHGIKVETPAGAPSGALAFSASGGPGEAHAFEAAQNACARYRPKPINASPADQLKMQEGALKFARCMRSHGVNIPDPTFQKGGVSIQSQSGPGGVNPNSAVFQAAQNACQALLGGKGKGAPPLSLSSHSGGAAGGMMLGGGPSGAPGSGATPAG